MHASNEEKVSKCMGINLPQQDEKRRKQNKREKTRRKYRKMEVEKNEQMGDTTTNDRRHMHIEDCKRNR